MFIKCLVENTNGGLKSAHGVCFYVETANHKLLFDLGPSALFYKNAMAAGIDISAVDTVIISHGHSDHGGGLETFLKHNSKATVYIQKDAFEKHYTKALFLNIPISLNQKFATHKQIKLIEGDYKIDDELLLFVSHGDVLPSPMNLSLLDKNKKPDDFHHEQSLLITENKKVLFTGCSHKGLFNILNSLGQKVDVQIGGFHLYNPVAGKTAPDEFLSAFKAELAKRDQTFYTCHCTGEKAYNYLKNDRVKYFCCGMDLTI